MSSRKIKSKYKFVFADMDDTLIQTYTKETFPKGIWDMLFKFDVLDKIKELEPEYILIVTNQGGIGTYVDKDNFEIKGDYVCKSIQEYTGITTEWIYCSSTDKNNENRKPNPGMANILMHGFNLYLERGDFSKEDVLMIGDADGSEGAFSDSDKKFAENIFGGVDFISPKELLEL